MFKCKKLSKQKDHEAKNNKNKVKTINHHKDDYFAKIKDLCKITIVNILVCCVVFFSKEHVVT